MPGRFAGTWHGEASTNRRQEWPAGLPAGCRRLGGWLPQATPGESGRLSKQEPAQVCVKAVHLCLGEMLSSRLTKL